MAKALPAERLKPNPVIALALIGLTPISPVIDVAPVVEIPDFVKIAMGQSD